MPGFSTEQAPKYFSGEDVIGDVLYGDKSQPLNPIPQQLAAKLHQFPKQQPDDYEEEFNIPANPVVVNMQGSKEVDSITKNIKINLEINLKINVI